MTSVFSKIIELALHKRISNFIEHFDLDNDCQHGFIRRKSSTSAMIDFVDKVINSQDNREAVLGIFYDYSKAFDTVNHNQLHFKMYTMGISGVANDWLNSFLSNRTQVVKTQDKARTYISQMITNVGVPQGAIISPLLFILFTNDL
jgi:hypothetical protein